MQEQLAQTSATIQRQAQGLPQGGRFLGGQRDILEAQGFAAAAAGLTDLINQAALRGNADLARISTGTTGLISTQIPPARQSLQAGQPFDFTGAGVAVGQIAEQLQQLGVFQNNRSPNLTLGPTAIGPAAPTIGTLGATGTGGSGFVATGGPVTGFGGAQQFGSPRGSQLRLRQ